MRIKELDSLRGIAAMFVVMAHITLVLPRENNIFRLGVSGVDLFFLISGFVIFMTIEKTKRSIDFIKARFGRLYPTYWVAVLYTFILFFSWSKLVGMPQRYSVQDLFFNLTMFQYYFSTTDIIPPTWTLLIEMQFYIFILILFKFNSLKHVYNVMIVCLIIEVIYIFSLRDISSGLFQLTKHYLPILNHLPLFLSGILFYKMTKEHKKIKNHIMIFLCFILQIYLFEFGGSDKDFMSFNEFFFIISFYYAVFYLLVFNKLFYINNLVTQFLGKISYSLYLIHLSASGLLISFFTKTKYFHLDFWVVILFIVIPYIILSSYFLCKYIEIPGIKIFKGETKLSLKSVKPSNSF